MTVADLLSATAHEALGSLGQTGTAPTQIAVGTDVTPIADVVEAIDTLGERYLRRVFTELEREGLGDCRSPAAAQSLAARFAAKEAVLKLLEPAAGEARPEWRSIEVERRPSGACRVALHHRARDLAEARGISEISLSMSHDGGLAIAVAIAVPIVHAGKDTRGV